MTFAWFVCLCALENRLISVIPSGAYFLPRWLRIIFETTLNSARDLENLYPLRALVIRHRKLR